MTWPENSEESFVIARAPLRISLAGGGTDVLSYARRYGGIVVGAAIDRFVGVTVYPRQFEHRVRVVTEHCQVRPTVADHPDPMIRACLAAAPAAAGLQFATFSDVPSGRGLGGSGALTVATTHALCRTPDPDPADLAERASAIEIDTLRRPVGRQDHYLAAFGGFRVLHFHPDGRTTVEELPVGPATREQLGRRLLLFDSGVARNAGDVLSDQDRRTAAGDGAVVDQLHAIRRLAVETVDHLRRGDFRVLGDVLAEHWELKSRLGSRVSSAPVEELIRDARKAGADGVKLLGSGGGGFLLAYCDPDHQDEVRRVMAEAGCRELPFGFTSSGSRVAALPV